MSALAYVCCVLAFWNPHVLTSVPDQRDCEAARSAAADAIAKEIEILSLALVPYESAIRGGNLVDFDEASPVVVQNWNGLLLAISQERRQMREAGCSDEGLPDPSLLPASWSVIRDFGAAHSVAQDRVGIARRFRSLSRIPMK